jgi:VWFA-related protein
MKLRLACLAVTMLLYSITSVFAQDNALQVKSTETPEEQKFQVKTELMEVRAVVTGSDGRIIENLGKDDFELLENDQPQEISFFSVSRIESRSGVPFAVDAKAQDKIAEVKRIQERLSEPPIRTTLLYVDNLHISFSSLNRVKEAIRRFIKERLTDQDMVALATSGQTLGIAQQFTRDRQLLNYAIEQIRLGPLRQESLFTPDLAVAVLADREDALRVATSIESRETGSNCCDMLLNLAHNHAQRILNEASYSRTATLMTLKGFAEQMIGLPGKRMIVLFSDGFTLHSNGGGIETNEVQRVVDRAVRSGVVIYSIDAKGLQAPLTIDASLGMPSYPDSNLPNFETAMELCTQAAQQAAVDPTFHVPMECRPCGGKLDRRCHFAPDPGQWSSFLNSSEREVMNGLHSLAEETGGKMYDGTNNLGDALGRAFDANRFYYVLSYYLPARSDNVEFRKIKVRVRNHPEYSVRTARGFALAELAAAEAESVKTPQQRLLQAMKAPLPVTDLGVSARADFVETENDDKTVSLTVYFDGDRFQYREQDQGNVFGLEILYAIYDSSGKQVEGVSANVQGNLSHDRLTQAKTTGYRFSRRLTLKPGVYQARIGVREEGTNRMGTATAWVDVPELAQDKLEMSSLILSSPLDIDSANAEGSADAGGMDVSGLEQIRMVQSIPLFARGDFFDYSFRVHRGTSAVAEPKLEWMPELFHGDRLIKEGQWLPIPLEKDDIDGKGWMDVYGEVDIGKFGPGVYELRVSVKDSRSNKTVQRTAVFSVE